MRDYMQPNRGIDCDPENVGRKQIILNTCSGELPNIEAGEGSLSVAEAVARTIKAEDGKVDIYAASTVLTPHADGRGRVYFFDGPRANSAKELRSVMTKLTPERRGGLLGTEQKTYVRREKVGSVSVRRTA